MYRKFDSWFEYQQRGQKADHLRACQPRWVLRKKAYCPLAPGLPDYSLGKDGWVQPRPSTVLPRVGLSPTLQSREIQKDFLKWGSLLKDFDTLMPGPTKQRTQYMTISDVKRTELRPSTSYIRSSLPFPTGQPISIQPPDCPQAEPPVEDSDQDSESEDEITADPNDPNLNWYSRKDVPPRSAIFRERICGRKLREEGRWFERMSREGTGRLVRAETMGMECLRAW